MEQVVLPACLLLDGFCVMGAGPRLLLGLCGINEQLQKSVCIGRVISALSQKTCNPGLNTYSAWFCVFGTKETSNDQSG
jgi:hypothetical protein